MPTSYKLTPEQARNVDQRIDLLDEAARNTKFQSELYDRCRTDVAFFFNFFLWTYNPKLEPNHFPFVLYPEQADLLKKYEYEIENGIGSLTEKSRETGVTYIHLGLRLHKWLFKDSYESMILSMREDEVDDWTPSSMFGKLRYMVDRLPFWLRPLKWKKRTCAPFLFLFNPDNGNTIIGKATTPDAGRSGRKTDVFVDEHASIPPRIARGIETALNETTNCIHRVSTPKGINLFKVIRDRRICPVHTIHWTRIPDKAVGLYYLDENGQKVDATTLPRERVSKYGFLVDGNGNATKTRLRSPWYDKKCREYVNARDVAQELDINYLGSGACRFDVGMIETNATMTRDGKRGFLKNEGTDADPKPVFVEVAEDAPFELEVWEFPTKPYYVNRSFVGADVAEGLENGDYCSGDVLIRGPNGMTSKHAAALHGHFPPDIFAEKLFLLGVWYDGGAELAIERNKDGLGVILDLGNRFKYRRLYKGGDDRDGWLTTAANKFTLTGNLDEALRNGEVRTESLSHYTELSTFENNNGKLGATGQNHDDRVISLSVAHEAARNGGHVQERSIEKGAKTKLRNFDFKGY